LCVGRDARFLVGDLPRRSTDPPAVANPGKGMMVVVAENRGVSLLQQ
jgi:hypothetical protein